MPISIVQRPAHPSNFRVGRALGAPRVIVIHTMQGSAEGTASWFAQQHPAGAATSAHYGISKTGAIAQYVRDEDTAFHAGNSIVNATSIGIELEGDCDKPGWRTQPMMDALEELCHALCDRYGIAATRENIMGHCDVPNAKPGHQGELGGAGRHHDPGGDFPFHDLLAELSGGVTAIPTT